MMGSPHPYSSQALLSEELGLGQAVSFLLHSVARGLAQGVEGELEAGEDLRSPQSKWGE